MQSPRLATTAAIITLSALILLGPLLAARSEAALFGEVALAAGGTYPQGNFVRYADPGVLANVRATIHMPGAEVLVFWGGFSLVPFSSEHLETTMRIEGGPTLPVTQTTTETMGAFHVGLQLASPTRRGFFRPRAAIGPGVYVFNNSMSWTYEDQANDTTISLASERLDAQTRLGWRGMLGVDFFIKPNFGITADFVYDQVFQLNQREGLTASDPSSRFHGFTVGIVYMFMEKKRR